jgi:putative lipase involved disintegration of autophagic bodies
MRLENIILIASLASSLLSSASTMLGSLSVPSISKRISIFSRSATSHNAGAIGPFSANWLDFSFNSSMPAIFGYPLIIYVSVPCWLRLSGPMKSFIA